MLIVPTPKGAPGGPQSTPGALRGKMFPFKSGVQTTQNALIIHWKSIRGSAHWTNPKGGPRGPSKYPWGPTRKNIRKVVHQTKPFWAPGWALKYPEGQDFDANSKMRFFPVYFSIFEVNCRAAYQNGCFGVPKSQIFRTNSSEIRGFRCIRYIIQDTP